MSHLALIRSDTKRQLLKLMKRQGEITLHDAVEAIDRTRPTLRDHLNQMGRDGLVARRSEQQGRGRPSMCYRLTPVGERLFPQREGTVFADFLAYLQEQGREGLIEAFFESFWETQLEEVKRRVDGPVETADREQVLDVLEAVLREEGFMPEIRFDEGQVTVRECNCPFAQVVETTEMPCSFEKCFYEALFEQAERTSHIPEGDDACAYELPVLE
jgi:predicted ArsR family transcriptional regulator